MTLKNVLNHFVNTTVEKQNHQRIALLVFGFAPAVLKNAHLTPTPTHHTTNTTNTTASPPFFPYWSLSGAKSDMRHISPGLELSLRGPHSEHH